MASPCENVELFVDGELAPEDAESFRQHLPDCMRCQREVADLMQLRLLSRRHAEFAEAEPPRAPVPLFRRRPFMLGVAALAAALLVMVGVRLLRPSAPSHDVWLAQRPQRLLEARLGHPGADIHRPLAAKMMGGGGPLEDLPFDALAWLEREDAHGLAAAFLVRDDPGLADQALRKLEKLRRSPELDNDRAVALLLKGRPDEALRLLDAVLREHPRHAQALWNRALALRELGLSLMAARTFSEVTALREPGWSEEARQKAEALRRTTFERRDRWMAAFQSGLALLEAPPAILPEGFSQLPIARLFFYNAIRAAPNRERVLELLPLARELDARAGNGVLEGYVRRVAEADFSRRAPLARHYAAHVREHPPREEQERIIKALLQSREDDILLGSLATWDASTRHLELYTAKAAATGDLWFQLHAAQERAKAELAAGDTERAIRTLLDARKLCPARGMEYRCLFLERDLSHLYNQRYMAEAALAHAKKGWSDARAANEWNLEGDLLWMLSQVSRIVNDASLTRAYLGEYLERGRGNPVDEHRVHQHLASMAFQELRVDEARREMDAALATGLPLTSAGALVLADISRLKRAPGDEAHLKRALDAARPSLSAGGRAVATHILGRFYIEQDAGRGRDLLWRAIQEAEVPGLEEDSLARRARAYSYTSLLHDAGRRGDFKEALELFSRERGLKPPGQCLLAISADSERTLLLALSPSGELLGHFDESRRHPLPERLDGVVPEKLLAVLRGCSRVEVLARPPLHGRAGLLPPELAWSYLTRTTPPPAQRTGPAVHLVVSDVAVELSPDSPLKRLNAWTPGFGPDEQRVTLSGTEATPHRVLAAMKDATEIDLVTHGIISGHANTSFLLLAPGPEGAELRVPQVRGASLRGAPFVVLAACHAAHTAYSFDSPFSLPVSFIEAGARGVLAATVEIPDLEAESFFNAVRERIRSGAPPAIALRDERVRWLGQKQGAAWLESVLLFE
ncbi:CHAT domain-containing protein [Myxococcus sp. RHSTA-1-4]|uniref:CHAT domain-containing protein n=1 Tax=Myxococcus sp. RHSTA-1-4 TaxID=2874601 RepID=UPI001CBCC592|nr:CHAT domain-containing protein [Myxococcus sp. RHSTA-1-4]MBZ4414973.1 CHAT domain-containing protein [Myxococcus sp. RHSTA-1-4]